MENLVQLFPSFKEDILLRGLYLQGEHLREDDNPVFYSNFITSLDGRIAVEDKGRMGVPENIANPRDWRLFQELAAQSDIIITSGRYLRDYADGHAQEILQVHHDPEFADLVEWRKQSGMPTYPDLVVISRTLDFPIPLTLISEDRRMIVLTTKEADPEKVKDLETQFGEVIVSEASDIDGLTLKKSLTERGYRTIYSSAGPRINHFLLESGVLDRLYLTITSRILGGDPFATIVQGPLLSPPSDFELTQLHYDAEGMDGRGQLFARFQRAS